jgi:hypothetical protein
LSSCSLYSLSLSLPPSSPLSASTPAFLRSSSARQPRSSPPSPFLARASGIHARARSCRRAVCPSNYAEFISYGARHAC